MGKSLVTVLEAERTEIARAIFTLANGRIVEMDKLTRQQAEVMIKMLDDIINYVTVLTEQFYND